MMLLFPIAFAMIAFLAWLSPGSGLDHSLRSERVRQNMRSFACGADAPCGSTTQNFLSDYGEKSRGAI